MSLDNLTDTTITNAKNNEVLTFDLATDQWLNEHPDSIKLTNLGDGWYQPKGFTAFTSSFWNPDYVTAVPIMFNKDFYFTDWAVFLKNWPTDEGLFATNGGKVHATLYKADEQYQPTNIFYDLGVMEISNISPGGMGTHAISKTIPTGPIVLEKGVAYWVALRFGVNDGESGVTSGNGPEVRQFKNTGACDILANFPVGDNNLSWSGGEKDALFIDFEGVAFGTCAAIYGGVYPLVTWTSAQCAIVSNGYNYALKGALD